MPDQPQATVVTMQVTIEVPDDSELFSRYADIHPSTGRGVEQAVKDETLTWWEDWGCQAVIRDVTVQRAPLGTLHAQG